MNNKFNSNFVILESFNYNNISNKFDLKQLEKDIKNNLAGDKDVKGLIIALEDDKNLRDALSVAPNIRFMKYEVSFKLVE